jgi:hypothetical protein
MNAFKQWLLDNYSHNELSDISNHGCTGGVSGMIYYKETYDLYLKFSAALHETLQEYKECSGEWPSYVMDEMGDDVRFANALVWFASEWFANEITHGEYQEETKEGANHV